MQKLVLGLGVIGIAALACSTDSRTFGESPSSGGAGGSGGAQPDGSPTGGQGGSSATGGGGMGASGSGGSAGTAGTGGGGGSGGTPDGGDAGVTARFRGGPCVASPENKTVEVFARGDNQQIYRRVVAGTDVGSWAALGDLDATIIDNRSDLDCGGNATSIHLAALGTQPSGSLLHAVGFGTTYNPFVHELTDYVFIPSPSVAVGFSDYLLVGLMPAYVHATNNYGTSGVDLVPTNATSFPWSGVDAAKLSTRSSVSNFLAAFDSTSQLTLYEYRSQSGGAVWVEPVRFPPPLNAAYEHAPTICAWYEGTTTNVGQVHLVVTAGGELWHTSRSTDEASYPAWRRLAADGVTSAPDCAITADGALHVVALDATGGVILVHGAPTSLVVTDLGVY